MLLLVHMSSPPSLDDHPLATPACLQVEGLARSASPMAAAQLAALGAAASWRLGKWELVEGYVQAADAGYTKLDTDARWEVGLGSLGRRCCWLFWYAMVCRLSCVHHGCRPLDWSGCEM